MNARRVAWGLGLGAWGLTMALTLGAADQAGQSDGLRIRIAAAPGSPGGLPRISVTFENTSPFDYVVNLGLMLGNGKEMFPRAVRFDLTDAAGGTRDLEYRFPLRVAGRIDDYIVPVQSGSTYGLSVSLVDFWIPANKDGAPLKLAPGAYRLTARFVGTAAQFVNSDTAGLASLNFWKGSARSNEMEFTIPGTGSR